MATHITTERLFEVLDSRAGDGIEVWLLWNRGGGALSVLVVDTGSDDTFELPVEAYEALEVFRHPYAYAGTRGVGPSKCRVTAA